ncbi:hypothetical protein MMC30_002404 [Trapelia coarctata]|nr:hypothetical protein [Trapelia coarctata]
MSSQSSISLAPIEIIAVDRRARVIRPSDVEPTRPVTGNEDIRLVKRVQTRIEWWAGKVRHIARHKITFSPKTMFLLPVTIIFLSQLLAGCSSELSTVRNTYLISFSYQRQGVLDDTAAANPNLTSTLAQFVGNASFTVRTGYFGLCMSSDDQKWICSKDAEVLASGLTAEQDPLNLLSISANFKDDVAFSGLLFIVIVLGYLTFCMLAAFPRWYEDMYDFRPRRALLPFSAKPETFGVLGTVNVGAVLALVSIVWQHTAAAAAASTAQTMGYGIIYSKVGPVAVGLGWSALALYIVVALSLWAIYCMPPLDELVDE